MTLISDTFGLVMLSHTYSIKMPTGKGTRIVMADSDFVRLTNVCHLNLKFVTFSRFKVVTLEKNVDNKFNSYFSLSKTGICTDFTCEKKQIRDAFQSRTKSNLVIQDNFIRFLVFSILGFSISNQVNISISACSPHITCVHPDMPRTH